MRIMIFTVAAAASLAAQDQDHVFYFQQHVAPPPAAGIRVRTAQFVSANIVGSGVKASPYSAESVVETTQALADGNRIVTRSVTKLFRDGEGRERRELSLDPSGEEREVLITDPVAGVSYSLNPAKKTAQKTLFFHVGDGPSVHAERLAGWAGAAQFDVLIQGAPRSGIVGEAVKIVTRANRGDVNEESLGARTIEGVMAQGTRVRTTIPAGQIGNERPIETVHETWYSPDLKMTVLSETNDPRMGKTVMKLINISRSEPPRSLFEVPPDYTMEASHEVEKVIKMKELEGIKRETERK